MLTGEGNPESEDVCKDNTPVKKYKEKEFKTAETDPDRALKNFNILHCNISW